jgi:spore maturation protein CgeB
MYRALSSASIVLNRHIESAEGHANNMRLFEATGMGALLLTEEAPNLSRLFEPGGDVATYREAADLADSVEHFLEAGDELDAIAAAGRRRTLEDHSYRRRMGELATTLQARLSPRS